MGDAIDYKEMVQAAMRDLVRRVLVRASAQGIPGKHHFYIGFRSHAPGVGLPPDLKQRHPEEMTIVLQHWFRDLEVHDDAFSVTLRFNARPRRVTVPFAAITRFVDPSVSFGLRFEPDGGGVRSTASAARTTGPGPTADGNETADREGDNVVAFDRSHRGDDGP